MAVSEKRKEYFQQYNKAKKETDPFEKPLRAVSSMRYIAKQKGNMKRVAELDKKYQELKRQRQEWKKLPKDVYAESIR